MVPVPMPPSEVVDRLTILDLKVARAAGPAAAAARAWRAALRAAWQGAALPGVETLEEHAALAKINAALWDVEDRLRAREAAGDFGEDFVQDARRVYVLNDARAANKAALDARLGEKVTDLKSYSTNTDSP